MKKTIGRVSKQSLVKQREKGFSDEKPVSLNTKFRRYNRYVLIPCVPEFKLAHAGLLMPGETTLHYHDTLGLSDLDMDLLQMGKLTRAAIKENICPRTLFLGVSAPCAQGFEVNEQSKHTKRYAGHFFTDYAECFKREEQFKDIYFEIAAHGNHEGIGGSMLLIGGEVANNRHQPGMLAEYLEQILSDESFTINKKGRKTQLPERFNIHITLHSCNSAYCDFTGTTTLEEKKERFIETSYVGRLAKLLAEQGIKGSVSGFRGYYHTEGRTKARVIRLTAALYGRSFDAENAKFTVRIEGKRVLEVNMPAEEYREFDVLFPEAPSITEKDTASFARKLK